ncbi:MAG: thioredoxin-disulfide reductase [Christensenellales bacterium]|jgi:thioredoxin reductase (NADPH)
MIYDLIIVGGGPAGLTSAIYALRAGLTVLLIEKAAPGGQIAITPNVENYPGYLSISGYELSMKIYAQAEELGLETIFDEIVKYELQSQIKVLHGLGNTYQAKSVILALGAKERQLELENEERLIGRGISYCATCDGAFFKGKTVAVVGGGNTSFDDCIYLSGVAKEIYLIHRKDTFRAEERLVSRVMAHVKENNPNGNINLVLNSAVVKINGDDKVSSIEVENLLTKERKTLDVSALFIAIGRKPDTVKLQGQVDLTPDGYIKTNEKMQTSVKGVFAAGDIRDKEVRQIVTATSDGAMAALSAHSFVRGG